MLLFTKSSTFLPHILKNERINFTASFVSATCILEFPMWICGIPFHDLWFTTFTISPLFQYLQEEGKREVDGITWEKVGLRIRALYEDVLRNYGK